MKTIRVKCTDCGNVFLADVLDDGEAESAFAPCAGQMPSVRVRTGHRLLNLVWKFGGESINGDNERGICRTRCADS